MEGAVALERLAEAPLFAEAQFLVSRDSVLVELEGAKADAVQAQFLETVAEDHADGLSPVSVMAVLGLAHDHGELCGIVRLADVHEADHADGLFLALEVDSEGVIRAGELPLLEESFHRGGAQGGGRPAGKAPNLRVSVPLTIEPVVLASVTPELDPLPDKLF